MPIPLASARPRLAEEGYRKTKQVVRNTISSRNGDLAPRLLRMNHPEETAKGRHKKMKDDLQRHQETRTDGNCLRSRMAKSSAPTAPSRPTIKRLYALSGNRCAFPDCFTRLVDRTTGSIVGEVCHIKGERPTAPRYDAAQSNAERHSFENLVLLCNVHHKIIDDTWQTYPVERLLKMKADHESRLDGKEPLDEQAADEFASAASGYFIQHGSVILATNQIGGQLAHSITNNYFEAPKYETRQIGLVGRSGQRDPRLSEQGIELLQQATKGDGSILVITGDAGLAVLVNGHHVNEMGNARSEALYRQVVENLKSAGFIIQTQADGYVVVYKLTHAGFALLDAIQ